jgi:hypothetical protein
VKTKNLTPAQRAQMLDAIAGFDGNVLTVSETQIRLLEEQLDKKELQAFREHIKEERVALIDPTWVELLKDMLKD